MRNPLKKRLLRELKSDFGKYLVIFILLTFSIGFVSGFLVAGNSMLIAYAESFEKYNIEDGHFRLGDPLTDRQREHLEKKGIDIYNIYYIEQDMSNSTSLRIYEERNDVDKVCLMEGSLPSKEGEIAVDRMYADNNDLVPGDELYSGNTTYKITGLVALSDYSALFYNNNDMMFDASAFGVAVVSGTQFEKYPESEIKYNYAYRYNNNKPGTEEEKKERADDLMERIAAICDLEDFVPEYLNQAISFTGEDMGSDKAMMEVLLYIIIVIMAFVFGITISSTIHNEAPVIGTLRALGYTKGELIRHYMEMPLFVTVVSAIAGNILGYTIFKDVCVSMYYGSYSLPTYVTIWNAEAFLKTTIIPLCIMMAITFLILKKRIGMPPLKLIRRDLSAGKLKSVRNLPVSVKFFDRFRMRVILQNSSSYITLFLGLFFANVLLFFGMMLPPLLVHFQQTVTENMLAGYTYLLQIPVGVMDTDDELSAMFSYVFLQGRLETSNPDAEKFSAYSLKTCGNDGTRVEEVTLYGIAENSRYIEADFDEKTVLVSSAYADKYGIKRGDVITLKEPYEEKYYGFKVTGSYDYDGGICVFMSKSHLNELLGMDEEFFAGYFSDTEITDIDSRYIGTVVDEEALTRVSRQLLISMGEMMYLVDVFSVVMFVVLIYLLSKLIIERNAQSISMVKILGYSLGEIAALYIVPTGIVVLISLIICYPVITVMMLWIFRVMLKAMMSGWLIIYLEPGVYLEMFILGIMTFAVVALFEYGKIGKISMSDALKNVE